MRVDQVIGYFWMVPNMVNCETDVRVDHSGKLPSATHEVHCIIRIWQVYYYVWAASTDHAVTIILSTYYF